MAEDALLLAGDELDISELLLTGAELAALDEGVSDEDVDDELVVARLLTVLLAGALVAVRLLEDTGFELPPPLPPQAPRAKQNKER